ncbi:MAG: hypothetical protein HC846_14165 [Blastocatellia bacterium]|nr:hypothetical protein [Blastocatellia bacterium]
MRKLKYIAVLFLTLILGVWGYRNYDSEYYKFCKSPEQDTNFKNLDIEEQFQIYVKYNCKYDSDPARIYWGFHIGDKEEAIDFLLNKLRTEKNDDILTHTLYMLRDSARQQEIKGRNDILHLVKQTADKISDKDDRSLVEKIFSSQISSMKRKFIQNFRRNRR